MSRTSNKPPLHSRTIQTDSSPRSHTLREGQIVSGHGHQLIVEDSRGNLAQCSARRKLGRLVCGDRVRWQASGRGQGVIESVSPRSTLIERHDFSGQGKPLAANVDRIIVTSAVVPPLSEPLIDRYLVAAQLTGAEAVILVNKSDLITDKQESDIEQRLQEYRNVGYSVLFCSTVTAHGTDQLVEALQSGISILVGQSGVGKSSLVRMLLPDQKIRIGHLSSATGLGRHTTSSTTLYHLFQHSDLIDSPGVRDFQLWHVAPDRIAEGFREFHHYLGKCRFHNCKHLKEPGCAVQIAANEQEISQRRLESYRTIVKNLRNKK